jgi:polyhydroxybutyrate depolymerase
MSIARIVACAALLGAVGTGCGWSVKVHEPRDSLGATPLVAGTFRRTVMVGDLEREYLVHVPAGYRGDRPLPVVLDFHGWAAHAREYAAYTGFDSKADAAGFLSVHPEGTGWFPSWNAGGCCGSAARDQVDDVAFVDVLLDDLARVARVDPARIYATGMSNGGMFAYRLACIRSERIAAIAPVAGAIRPPECHPARPVPVLHIHGLRDDVAPFRGGSRWWSSYVAASVPDVVSEWGVRDGCAMTPFKVLEQGEVTCTGYPGCSAGSEVELCTVLGGGHTWPGARWDIGALGPATEDLNATDAIWEFFARHPLPLGG